jgi:hypothetical protein
MLITIGFVGGGTIQFFLIHHATWSIFFHHRKIDVLIISKFKINLDELETSFNFVVSIT